MTNATNFYDQDTRVTRIAPAPGVDASYAGEVSDRWFVGSVPHGGYICAILFNAILTHFEAEGQGTPLSLDISYFNPSTAEPCRIDITILNPGRNSTVAQVAFYQPSSPNPRVHVLATMTSSTTGPSLSLARPSGAVPWSLPDPSQCTRFVLPDYARPPKGSSMLDHVGYLAADNGESERGVAESRGWCNLPGRPCDDWRSMVIRDSEESGTKARTLGNLPKGTLPYACWVPTLEIHALFHAPPSAGNLSFQARHVAITDVNDGRHVVDGEVRDEEGNLLVSMRQLAVAVPWAKNTSQGKKVSKKIKASLEVQSNL
ncbi:thioesterase-like superfamily-domain-containing protein [Blyttiomyces helicus]|uniref:Thioesterase-like superfamily-domain-containing protein n=1 Tax=Blyttiomyces helicus TaxID=388810 RepID=A0A4P9W6A4_9FUNG|nr:thioesterase-like superfamily-domain-containing protein [Blyttiomyces helicus]|eukprot:RKO85646.1 thioesterase-like superfamily-domain-containing protein [Blyttiomyces helicus]